MIARVTRKFLLLLHNPFFSSSITSFFICRQRLRQIHTVYSGDERTAGFVERKHSHQQAGSQAEPIGYGSEDRKLSGELRRKMLNRLLLSQLLLFLENKMSLYLSVRRRAT